MKHTDGNIRPIFKPQLNREKEPGDSSALLSEITGVGAAVPDDRASFKRPC
jgi:hypothetical protein